MTKNTSVKMFSQLLLTILLSVNCMAQDSSYSAYELKAGFLYNFLLFIEHNPTKEGQPDESIIIGILGNNPFSPDAFDDVKGTLIKGRTLVIKNLKADASIEELSACKLVFIPSGNLKPKTLTKTLNAMKQAGVLTVGEQDDFLKNGGMINLVRLEDKVAFEINNLTAKQAGISFRSKLLRIAIRVIDKDKPKEKS